MDAVLELRGVTKQYPNHRAVDSVSLTVERGALFALLGPSGCGKTTILRMVAGFEQPTEGEVLLGGHAIKHLRPYQRNVSTVFQSYALFPHLTVRANVEFGLRRRGMGEIERRVNDVLDLVRLTGKESRRPAQLSGGERQRTALARSLVVEPEILLLDEPLSALDPNLRQQVRVELKALQRRVGITFLLVTHDQEEALTMSDRIAVMNRGKLEQIGTPEEMYLKPRTRFVAGFFGDINWIGDVGVRPESTRLATVAPHGGVHHMRATVASVLFLGPAHRVEARLENGTTVTAEISLDVEAPKPGVPVHVWWSPADEIRLPEAR